MDYNNFTSSIAGYISIGCWLIVFTPQLWENYVRKSGDGLSMPFLVIWLAGDVFNLLGVIMQDLLPTMFLLALYYTVADMGLIWQVIYYRNTKKKSIMEEEILPSETSSLINDIVPSTSYTMSDSSSTKTLTKSTKANLFNVLSAFSIVLVTVISCYSYYYIHNHHGKDEDGLLFIPQVMGWTSAVLYVGSRIPQILKNWKNKSTEGLSFAMFTCAVLGNVFFTASIFLKSTDSTYILMNLSWIIGSCGTLVFDFIIFIQFFIYDKTKKLGNLAV